MNNVQIERKPWNKYHVDIYFPDSVKDKLPKPNTIIELAHTEYAKDKAKVLGGIILSKFLNFNKVNIIEAKMLENDDGGLLLKELLVRKSFNSNQDICMVIKPTRNPGFFLVKTVWLNNINDKHETLNKDNYVQSKD